MKLTLLSTLFLFGISHFSQSQTVSYEIGVGSLLGLELTSGDICSSPFTIEEAKQISIGNSWGATWTSTNSGIATSINIDLGFTVGDSVSSHPTTLNGNASNTVDPGGEVNCAPAPFQSWVIDPANYNSMGLNTFLVDYSASAIINQIDNLPFLGDVYILVTVEYDASGIGVDELSVDKAELVKIVDLTGRETEFVPNTPLIYIYSDGSVKRVYEIQE